MSVPVQKGWRIPRGRPSPLHREVPGMEERVGETGILAAIMKANNGKSPGGEGNTEEFYKQIQHSLTPVADPSIQWQNGKISQCQKPREPPQSHRPLTRE